MARVLCCFAASLALTLAARAGLGDGVLADSMLGLVIVALTLQVGALVCIAFFLRENGTGWTAAFGFKTNWRTAVLVGLAVGMVAVPVLWMLQALSGATLSRLGIDVREQEAVQLLRGAHTLGQQVFVAVMAVLLAPPVEEMFFRGILYPFIKQAGFPRWALWGVAICFALIHGNIGAFVPLVGLAVGLALLYEWTDNLLTGIIVHAVFNAVNFAALFYLNAAGRSPGLP